MTLSAAYFELLLQANRILSSKLNVDDVLVAVMELATKVVRAEASSLLLLDDRTNELYFDVALGAAKERVKQIRIKVGEGIAGWVAKERSPLIVNDVTKDKRFTGKVDKSTSFKTRSILAVPLIAKGRLIGVVEAINKENNRDFMPEDQEAFEVFASQAAIAIENARLFSVVMREKEKLNTVFAEMSDGVLLLDVEGKVLLLNDTSSRLLGLKNEEAIGRKFGPELWKEFEATPAFAGMGTFQEKATAVELVRKKGKDLYISALVHRLHATEGGSHEGYLAILRDTTEERRGERLKRNFLSLISHKLKTPLTVIVGYAPTLLLKPENLSDFQKKALQSISDQGEQLSGLVDKLLRFAIVESDTLERTTESKSLLPLIKEAMDGVSSLKEEKEVKVKIEPGVSSLPEVMVDSSLTIEVFKNLLEYAVNFNDKEKKQIVISSEKKNGGVTVHVSDNGVGIPSEERDKVFQKFYQIENSFTGQVPGAGLGLALCKKVVEEMGGKIQLQSELGKGTKVSVTFRSK